MRTSTLLASLFVGSFATYSWAAESAVDPKASAETKDPHAFATLPEGKTLPEGVLRARIGYSMANGTGSSFDSDGKKQDAPFDVKGSGGAAIIEYGLTDKMSLQLQVDFVAAFETKVNSKTLELAYRDAVASDPNLTALETAFGAQVGGSIDNRGDLEKVFSLNAQNEFKKSNLCTTLGGDCANLLASNNPAAVAARESIAENVALADGMIQAGAKDQVEKKGGRGLADTTIGVLYEAYHSEGLHVALAGGLRYPTGNRDRAANERPTGRGVTEVGARFNIDYNPIPELGLAWQNQSEVMAASGKYKVAGEAVTVSRKGVRNVGFFMVKPSLAGMSEALAGIGPKVGFAYDYDSEERVKRGSEKEAPTNGRAFEGRLLAGLSISTFDYGIPLHFDVEYRKSLMGKNVLAATDSLTTQVKAYYKF